MKLSSKLLTGGLVVGGTVGTLAVVNRLSALRVGKLDTKLTGEEQRYRWKYGDIFYQVQGARDARPLLLIHSFAVGASSYEWRKNADPLAQQFRIYAIDLLGFGLSDHPSIDYTAEDFADLISDFVNEVIDKPTIVVAHGLTCAYAIANAYRRPQFFERLVLVTPPASILQETEPDPIRAALKFVLRTPILGQFIYEMLASHQAIRSRYDRQGYRNPGLITDELVEYTFISAHQRNARLPIASLLGNALTIEVHEPLAGLQVPVVAIWGREAPGGTRVPLEASEAFKRVNPNIDIRMLDNCGLQPQDEQASQFNDLVRQFAGAVVKQ